MGKDEEQVSRTEAGQVIEVKESGKGKVVIIIAFVLILVLFGGSIVYLNFKDDDQKPENKDDVVTNKVNLSSYTISGNDLNDFDLAFLQIQNNGKNVLYSPLSIKYALAMLAEGSDGETKEQITSVLGDYEAKKYTNSANMSFANALFVKDSYKDSISDTFVNTLLTKYNASVVYDSFEKPDVVNNWVSDNTFDLINKLYDDISAYNFILANSLAIDMEWVNKIQSVDREYIVEYDHRDYSMWLESLMNEGYRSMEFEGVDYDVSSMQFAAVINKYDIINVIGEQNIRDTVTKDYQAWLDDGECCGACEDQIPVDVYVDDYIEEISVGYKDISSSTDFKFYVDDDVKVFAKDLKEYDGTTLQYIGIMPTKEELTKYLENVKASDVNTLINSLQSVELDNFKEGVLTEITGQVPLFKFDYEIDLIKDLKTLGIEDVFNPDKADLSKLTSADAFIEESTHKTNITFSNDGIKAAAVTTAGGMGSADCSYDYIYEMPVEKIDLTFNRPFFFLIRDKESGEVWFTGSVYEPDIYDDASIYTR